MGLAQELTDELKDWLTPAKLRSLNDGWREKGLGHSDRAVKHPSLLTLAKDDFSGEHSREFRTALAEVISEALAARLVKKEHGDQLVDVSTLYQRHAQQQTKILPPIQKVLISS